MEMSKEHKACLLLLFSPLTLTLYFCSLSKNLTFFVLRFSLAKTKTVSGTINYSCERGEKKNC